MCAWSFQISHTYTRRPLYTLDDHLKIINKMSEINSLNREESESSREIREVMELLNSTNGDKNSAECDDKDNSIADLKNPSNEVYQVERCISITNQGTLKWLRNFEDLRHVIDQLKVRLTWCLEKLGRLL